MNKKILSLYGLKFNPFTPEIPNEALLVTPKIESFAFRVEQSLLREGGFALVTGDPGTGKSVALRVVAERLARVPDVTVGVISRPQAFTGDFYREMGDLFGVSLTAHNRWVGTKALREKWQTHIDSTLARPILIVDEAQEMRTAVLSELRLLSSLRFDSKILLTVILAGDARLVEKLKTVELLPLSSRIRTRVAMDYATTEDLLAYLKHVLSVAGNASLMTRDLTMALCDHAMGNFRVLMNLGSELLATAAERELVQIDEKLFLEVSGAARKAPSARPPSPGAVVRAAAGARR